MRVTRTTSDTKRRWILVLAILASGLLSPLLSERSVSAEIDPNAVYSFHQLSYGQQWVSGAWSIHNYYPRLGWCDDFNQLDVSALAEIGWIGNGEVFVESVKLWFYPESGGFVWLGPVSLQHGGGSVYANAIRTTYGSTWTWTVQDAASFGGDGYAYFDFGINLHQVDMGPTCYLHLYFHMKEPA